MSEPAIVLLRERIDPLLLKRLVDAWFEDMVKLVADVRPAHDNRSMEIEDAEVRSRVAALAHRLIGAGEPLA